MNTHLFNVESFPIIRQDLVFAKDFLKHISCDDQKYQRILQNLVAIRVVERWLNLFNIATDFSNSYSANPLLHHSENIADLWLPKLGRLECRVVVSRDLAVEIPPETWCDRLGYVVVQLSDDLKTATLFGFLPEATGTMVPLEQLQPLDEIFTAIAIREESVWYRLQDWARETLETGWQIFRPEQETLALQATRGNQTLEELYDIIQHSPSIPARRNAIKVLPLIGQGNRKEINLLVQVIKETEDNQIRWDAANILSHFDPSHPNSVVYRNKLFNFDLNFREIQINLQVALLAIDDHKIRALIEVKPIDPQSLLPSELRFAILDDQAQVLKEEISRGNDNCLKISFTFAQGDYFRIRLALGDCIFMEDIDI